MEKDTTNYMKYKMGYSQKILLADDAVLSKFHCQEDRKRRLSNPECSRELFHKRQRSNLITECLQSQNAETYAESLQKYDNIIQPIIEPEGFGGRTSDVTIVENCNFLDELQPGSCILADRGFKHIEQILHEKERRWAHIKKATVRLHPPAEAAQSWH
ncbi:hypothetical protein EVAR_21051_1 [Eumeta japonica]|uniref:DDE Tnp4 domain-containing protein n=1 Tax=Eumeta variegata TaxID=151549 RepID=A0A4C1UZV7_EUMVA|nr:hypothetical protein EVAR_21051_1 [Eumeta japonica]